MKRPFIVSIFAVFLMAAGALGLVTDWLALRSPLFQRDQTLAIAGIHALAILAGAFILRGQNWARWLAIAWISLQVILSLWRPPTQLLVHTILFAVFLWCLFRGKSGVWFTSRASLR